MKKVTPLHAASRRGLLDVARILLDHGANPNAMDDHGRTPLHLILAHNSDRQDFVELLLKCGADATAQDKNLKTPLQLALSRGQQNIARILRNNGADVNPEDDRSQSAVRSLLANARGTEEMPRPTTPGGGAAGFGFGSRLSGLVADTEYGFRVSGLISRSDPISSHIYRSETGASMSMQSMRDRKSTAGMHWRAHALVLHICPPPIASRQSASSGFRHLILYTFVLLSPL